jgi:arylsulfatase A-like enzyme
VDTPFFLVIQTYEAHMPYRNREFVDGVDPGRIDETFEFTQQGEVVSGELVLTDAERDYIARLYDGDIRSTDRHVGEFLALLRELGVRDRTVVVVTSDHGEELGDQFENYIGGHGHSLRDNLLLVPLVIDDPTREFAVTEVSAQVRTLDLLPTIAELLGIDVGREIAGRSLLPLLNGEDAADRIAMSADNRRGAARLGIRNGRYKYIATIGPPRTAVETSGPPVPAVQLYDLDADPHETKNLARTRPRLRKRLAASVTKWWNGLGGPAVEVKSSELDEKMRDRLKALGYVE